MHAYYSVMLTNWNVLNGAGRGSETEVQLGVALTILARLLIVYQGYCDQYDDNDEQRWSNIQDQLVGVKPWTSAMLSFT